MLENLTPEVAKEILWNIHLALEKNKPIEAFLAIGMEMSWMEELTFSECVDIFSVRLADLQKYLEENNA